MSEGSEKFTSGPANLNLEQFLFFNRQLASMARLDLPISSGLKSLAKEVTQPKFRTLIDQIQQDMEQGRSLHQAMEKYPTVFSRLYLEILKAGESTGNLATVLEQLAAYSEVMQDTKAKIKNALMYPICVGVMVVSIFIGILVFAVPQFEQIFSDNSGLGRKLSELPLSTQMMIFLSSSLRNYQISIPVMILGVILLIVVGIRFKNAVANFNQSIFHVPIFGTMFRQVTLLKICRTLSDLLRSGVSIIEALALTRNMTGNNKMGEALESMRQAVENGERMSDTCRKSGAFPESMVWKLTMAEERGIIEDSLEELSNYYSRELSNTCSRIVQIIQPLMLVFLAAVVGIIVVSLYLPLFQLIG